MKSYKNLYQKLCSKENLMLAFKKAKRDKANKLYVIEFESNLDYELNKLREELLNLEYKPYRLRRFIIRDPKTRTIHSSIFRDRVIHHAIVNILEPIYEKIFIHDSYASRLNKGALAAINRFDRFKWKVSNINRLVKNAINNNQIKGYFLKADIRKYFETVDHHTLLEIIGRKIKDEKVIWLIKQILDNFETKTKGKGMPLGNLTSQFFANVYLSELDYFIKHKLRIKYYIRYVDDFVILDENKQVLQEYKNIINNYLKNIRLELHPDKSKIKPLRNGITFLGYRIHGKYKLLRKSNLRKFQRELEEKLSLIEGRITFGDITDSLNGWFGYAKWANTYKLRKRIIKKLKDFKYVTNTIILC